MFRVVRYDHKDLRMEGVILGFDEYMNVVLDDAEEVLKGKSKHLLLNFIRMILITYKGLFPSRT